MGRGQGAGDLNAVLQGLLEGQRALGETRGEGFAFQALHDQEVDAVLMSDVVEDTDVRMIQAGDGARFALETLPRVGIVRQVFRQNLDSYGAVEPGVAGAVNLAHATGAEGGKNFVGAEAHPGDQRHSS